MRYNDRGRREAITSINEDIFILVEAQHTNRICVFLCITMPDLFLLVVGIVDSHCRCSICSFTSTLYIDRILFHLFEHGYCFTPVLILLWFRHASPECVANGRAQQNRTEIKQNHLVMCNCAWFAELLRALFQRLINWFCVLYFFHSHRCFFFSLFSIAQCLCSRWSFFRCLVYWHPTG